MFYAEVSYVCEGRVWEDNEFPLQSLPRGSLSDGEWGGRQGEGVGVLNARLSSLRKNLDQSNGPLLAFYYLSGCGLLNRLGNWGWRFRDELDGCCYSLVLKHTQEEGIQ